MHKYARTFLSNQLVNEYRNNYYTILSSIIVLFALSVKS